MLRTVYRQLRVPAAGAASVPVLSTAVLLLAVPALAAIAVPGRRASLLDPTVTLRRE